MPQCLQARIKEAIKLAVLVLDSEFFTQARSFEGFSEQGLFEVGNWLISDSSSH